jgi:tetratricopeptide (TPR) repeat protein
MKRVLITLFLAVAVTAMALAQAAPGPAAPQATAPQGSKSTPPAAPTGNQAAPAAPAPLPQGKPQPQAKTQEEYKTFQEAYAITDPAAAEKAADDFAAKFKDSELRPLLYHRAMSLYQNANNAEKTIDAGRKVLAIDATNPVALVTVATVLAERTRESDLDRDQRLAEATSDAQKALQNIDTGLLIPPGTPQPQVDAAKKILASMAWAALGTVDLARNNYAAAEANLRKSVELNTIQPDAVTWLRLSVVLDHEKKYPEAMAAANKALELSPAGSPQATLAQQERDRLAKLTGTPLPAATPAAAPSGQPPAPAAQPPAAQGPTTKPAPK